MTGQPTRRTFFGTLVWVALAPSMVYFALLLFDLLRYPLAPGGVPGGGLVYRLLVGLVIGPGTMLVGALIVRRVPGNVVGPLLILYGIGVASGSVRFDVELPEVAAVYELNVAYSVGIQLPALMCLLFHFPDGQCYPQRSAGWVSAYAVFNFFFVVLGIVSSARVVQYGDVTFTNPYFIAALAPLRPNVANWDLPSTFLVAALPVAIISLALRYRASAHRERQQIKWMVYSGACLGFILIGWPLSFAYGFVGIWRILTDVVIGALPAVAIGISILRYRLWDIDVIIRRTVTYALLSALLLVVYFGGVVILQQVFVAFTGQRSEIAIIISTLAIAALSVPLRNRIQSVIDRRFYRRKYDAQRVLESFALTARDETDPDRLAGRLLDVVDDSLQPTQASLWMQRTGREVRR